MEDTTDRDRERSAHRLTLCHENFDDYVVALTAELRSNLDADRVLFGETLHPLLTFQDNNRDALAALNVPWVTPQTLFNDPVTPQGKTLFGFLNWLSGPVKFWERTTCGHSG